MFRTIKVLNVSDVSESLNERWRSRGDLCLALYSLMDF